MTFDGCNGKRGPELQEKICPSCGEAIEIASTDISADCPNCGFTFYNDLMSCVFNCPHARECVGEEQFSRLSAAKEHWMKHMEEFSNDDEW